MSKHSDYYPQFEPDSGPMVTDAQKIATLQNDVKYWRDYALSLENLRDNTLRLNRMLRRVASKPSSSELRNGLVAMSD